MEMRKLYQELAVVHIIWKTINRFMAWKPSKYYISKAHTSPRAIATRVSLAVSNFSPVSFANKKHPIWRWVFFISVRRDCLRSFTLNGSTHFALVVKATSKIGFALCSLPARTQKEFSSLSYNKLKQMNKCPSVLISGRRDSNSRQSAWKADTLPTELLPHKVFIGTQKCYNKHFWKSSLSSH